MKSKKMLYVLMILVLAFVLVFPVLASGNAQAEGPVSSPAELSIMLQGIVGVVISALFKYVPKLEKWYKGLPHQGVTMLAMVAVVGAIYFALACTPYAVALGIAIACEGATWFLLAQTIGYMVFGSQAGYLFLPSKKTV